MTKITGSIPRDAIRVTTAAGGGAGSIAVPGIKARDRLAGVLAVDFAGATITDLTAEFTPQDGAIDNTGGTATTGKMLIVAYVSVA